MSDTKILRVGDEVIWRGSWGADAPMRARVVRIERTAERRSKYGTEVQQLPWSVVQGNYAIVDLDNRSWAYGEQLSPVPEVR